MKMFLLVERTDGSKKYFFILCITFYTNIYIIKEKWYRRLKINILHRYSTFVNWELWWPNFPILVYFKERQTKPEGQVHFFPVIFVSKKNPLEFGLQFSSRVRLFLDINFICSNEYII